MSIPKNAVPTPLGWVHEETGELLKSQKMTASYIANWYGHTAPVNHPPVQTLHESPVQERVVTHEEQVHHGMHVEDEEE